MIVGTVVAGRAEQLARRAAVASLASAVATGTGVQLGVIDTSRGRWIHHALYGATLVSCSAVAAIRPATQRQVSLAMVVTLAALAALSRTRGGSLGHGVVAGVAVASCGSEMTRRR